LAPRSSTCDAQRAAPRATVLAPRSNTCVAARASAWAPRSSTCHAQQAVPREKAWALRVSTCVAPLESAWAKRPSTCDAQRTAPRAAAWSSDQVPATRSELYTNGAADTGLGATIKYLRRTTSGTLGNGRAQQSSPCDAKRTGHERYREQRPGRSDQVLSMHSELSRGQRPWHRDQLPARRRGLRPGIHDQIPSGATGSCLGTTV
jgi:hypothetical protein